MGKKTDQTGALKNTIYSPGEPQILVEYRCPKCGRHFGLAIEGSEISCQKCKIWVNEKIMAKHGIIPKRFLPLGEEGDQLQLF